MANVFKQVLRDMAEPVCTFDLATFFTKSTFDEEMQNCDDAVIDYKKLFDPKDKRLPELNKNTIQWLILFMRRLVKEEETSKMGDQNIGLMFAGNMIRTN